MCVYVCVRAARLCVGEGKGGLWSEMGKGRETEMAPGVALLSLISHHPCICILSLVFPIPGVAFPPCGTVVAGSKRREFGGLPISILLEK